MSCWVTKNTLSHTYTYDGFAWHATDNYMYMFLSSYPVCVFIFVFIFIYIYTYSQLFQVLGKGSIWFNDSMKIKHQTWGSTWSQKHQCLRTRIRPFGAFHSAKPRHTSSQADSLGRSHLCTQLLGPHKMVLVLPRWISKTQYATCNLNCVSLRLQVQRASKFHGIQSGSFCLKIPGFIRTQPFIFLVWHF